MASMTATTPAAATIGWSIYSLTSLTWATYTAWAEAKPSYTRSGEIVQQSTITPAAATIGWSIYSLTSLTWATYTAWAEAKPSYTRSGEIVQQSTMGAA